MFDFNQQNLGPIAPRLGGPYVPSLIIISDSIEAQSWDPPNSGFGATSAKGSYVDLASVKQVGVTNVYPENPVRLKFRAAHNLVTGDEGTLRALFSGHPLAYLRARCQVTAADEVILPGINGVGMPSNNSSSAATDALFQVDMAYGNYGPLSWAFYEAGFPFDRIDQLFLPGGTTAQCTTKAKNFWPQGQFYTHALIHVGRNDTAFSEADSEDLYDLVKQRCGAILVALPFPDDNWTTPASDAAAAKITAMSEFWYQKQLEDPRVRVSDLFGAFSNPAATLQSSVDAFISSDGTHPQANGALVAGLKLATDLFSPIRPARRALARAGTQGNSLLPTGRFIGTGGTVGSGVTGNVATDFTVGGRSSANVTGGYVQVCQSAPLFRRNSTAYNAGDILDIEDGYLYIVKTAGTTAAALPAGYATAVMFDSTTGVTDGTVVAFRIPNFIANTEDSSVYDYVRWQYIDMRCSAGTNENISFFRSISLPSTVPVGSYIRGEFFVVELGGWRNYVTARLTCNSSVPTQLARAHTLGPNNLLQQRPSMTIRPRKMQTPRLRVPNDTATIELRLTLGAMTEGAQILVGLPMIEVVSG